MYLLYSVINYVSIHLCPPEIKTKSHEVRKNNGFLKNHNEVRIFTPLCYDLSESRLPERETAVTKKKPAVRSYLHIL
jgi:hypothetical protein